MKHLSLPKRLASVAWCGLFAVSAAAQVTLNVDAGQRGPAIGARHYGIFFEEINHAGDGGLYAELIHNRSFEDNASNPDKWWAVNGGRMAVTTENLLNDAQGRALELEFYAAGDGVRNEGFWGINIVDGQTYDLSFWLRGAPSWRGTLTAALQRADGTVLGSVDIPVDADGTWQKYTAQITATGSDGSGWFALTGSTAGTVALDVVSLFPPTYKDRPNGCRPDLAKMLEDMNPSFVRFPGGCYVEGFYANGSTNRFEWKKTIGPIEQRPGHMNQNWGYRVSDGFGFHEMLQLTEDLGAEPLFVVNIGLGHAWMEEYTDIDEYIQEALDAIEYCNGDAETTTWGALRAANGHPEPFNLRLLEVGNENYNFYSESNADQSDHYAERYEQFRKAIKAKYPEVTIIGNVESWGTDDPSWRNVYPVDVVDEHYYRNPTWFIEKYNKYDSYSRSSHKIYVGEYAVTQNFGVNGHLMAALGEAVFMQGMENNSDVCVMNSYAPIFVNENNYNWRPDMIRFNSYTSYGTPSYYVQQLFPNNVGKQNVKWTETGNSSDEGGTVGLSTWITSATFDNVKLTAADGTVLFSDDFSAAKPEWTAPSGGTWSLADGQLVQSDASMKGAIYTCNVAPGTAYTYELEATKTGGDEGFLVAFNYKDADNYCWWNIGGWGNTRHAVEVCRNGSKTTVAAMSGSLETGRTYKIKVEVDGTNVKCYLDGTLMHSFTLPTTRKVYVSSNIDDEAGVLYLKLVNPSGEAQTVNVNLANASVTGGTAVVLTSASATDENSLENPDNVVPRETTLNISGTAFTYDVAPYSLHILRLQVTDVAITPDVSPAMPEPLVQYSFEGGTATDDSGRFAGQLQGGASVVTMDDGNRALYTGAAGSGGYLDLGADMVQQALAGQDLSAYTLSIDLSLPGVGTLAGNCWAYGIVAENGRYVGLSNSAGNQSWGCTQGGDFTARFFSRGGLSYGVWHNLTFVQDGETGAFYVDGVKVSEGGTSLTLADLASAATEAQIGRSPSTTDAPMSEVYFDNFRIYNAALDGDQVAALYDQVKDRATIAPEVAYAADEAALSSFLKKFNYLHATTALPESTEGGIPLAWSFVSEGDWGVSLSGNTLAVGSLPQDGEAVRVGVLKAEAADGSHFAMEQPVYLAPDDNRHGYLYCFMNSTVEITNYALGSKEDLGKRFNVLLEGGEIFDTEAIAGIEHGTRDAYIGRGEGADGYFITTTDMKQHASGVWNNYGINLVRSKDMVHWESSTFDFRRGKSIFSDPEANTGVYDTDAAYANINRVWAPQFIWDKDYNGGEGAYLVYYSILSSNDGDNHDRIFYSYTDREFRTLTQPRVFFDPGISVIDADIVYNPYDGLYHMYYKREGATGYERGIYEATSPRLVGGEWTDIMHVTNEGANQVEGSSTVRRINEDVYNLYYMRYSGGNAYKVCETDHVGLNTTSSVALEGTGAFQHGSVMTVTKEEYDMLQAWSDVRGLLGKLQTLVGETGTTAFDEAIAQANEALAQTSVSALATALPAAYSALRAALEDYARSLSGEADLTFLLTNPSFDNNTSTGWVGTSFTQTSNGVGEFWNKTFDTYQVLAGMPAGTYRFECQGFYRDGGVSEAYAAHTGGREQIRSALYANNASHPFMSLYDASAPYTYDPYTYPDNVWTANSAFNTDGSYVGNSVECTLLETGDLRLGVRQSEYRNSDWTCFDNFKLFYTPQPDAIAEVVAAPSASEVDVYTLSGVKVRSHISPEEAAGTLPRGVYIVGQKKMLVK